MENLVGRKVKFTPYHYRGYTQGNVYDIIRLGTELSECFVVINDEGREEYWHLEHIGSGGSFELLPNKPQFKQGDKVLVSNNEKDWVCRKFIIEHKNKFLCEVSNDNESLGHWGYIKPYKEEIKIGDWVFLNDEIGVCKITDKHDLKEVNNKFTLVKNPQLIELLNNEL